MRYSIFLDYELDSIMDFDSDEDAKKYFNEFIINEEMKVLYDDFIIYRMEEVASEMKPILGDDNGEENGRKEKK